MIFFFDTDNFFSVLVSVQTIYLFLLFFCYMFSYVTVDSIQRH